MAKQVDTFSLFNNLLTGMNFMYRRRDERDKSRVQRNYLAGVRHSTEAIRAVIREGTLEECLAAVDGMLMHDLEFLAKTETQTQAIMQNIENFTKALNNLDAIKNRPEEYRRQADGYINDYMIGGEIPKDGMHGALRAFMGHLKARDSQYLMPEESDFISAQKELVTEITERYSQMQRKTLKTKAAKRKNKL